MGDLKRWLWELIKPLMNERGEVGDPKPDPDPEPGDPAPDPAPDPDPNIDPDPAPDPDPKPAPEYKLEDGFIVYPDGEKIPVDRFGKIYHQGKEHERNLQESQEKLTLLQTSPEEYFKKYPDEKKVEAVPTQAKIGDMRVTGGEHDGMTLTEVYEIAPAEAQQIQFNYMNSQRDAETETRDTESRMLEQTNTELESFSQSRAKDFFNKEFSALSETESGQINKLIESVIAWGKETGRGSGKVEDIYFLMHKDTLLSAEKGKGIQALIDGQAKSIPSIAGGGKVDTGAETGYSRFLGMSDDQMATEIGDMSDTEYLKFKKEAPAELKKKHPGLNWN